MTRLPAAACSSTTHRADQPTTHTSCYPNPTQHASHSPTTHKHGCSTFHGGRLQAVVQQVKDDLMQQMLQLQRLSKQPRATAATRPFRKAARPTACRPTQQIKKAMSQDEHVFKTQSPLSWTTTATYPSHITHRLHTTSTPIHAIFTYNFLRRVGCSTGFYVVSSYSVFFSVFATPSVVSFCV